MVFCAVFFKFLVWCGADGYVSSGLAGVKLSGSLRIYGSFRVKTVRAIKVIMNPRMSLVVKYG